MACDEALRVQAYLDGETDAATALEIERHLESCADCAALKRDMAFVGTTLRNEASYHRATPSLRARLADALDRESGAHQPDWIARIGLRARSFWAGAAGGASV